MPLQRQALETLYQVMVRIRRFDEKTVELFNAGQVKGTAHSYVGQEAVATGACAHLTKDDSVISNHRGHGHCIAKGARLDFMMAELMGREDGYCRASVAPCTSPRSTSTCWAPTASWPPACPS